MAHMGQLHEVARHSKKLVLYSVLPESLLIKGCCNTQAQAAEEQYGPFPRRLYPLPSIHVPSPSLLLLLVLLYTSAT